MKYFRFCLIVVLIIVLTTLVSTAFADENTKVYDLKMISEEVAGDPMTIYGEQVAKLVEERSNGRMKITVFPYGTLGGERDIVELVQMGEIELGSVDAGWLGGFVPEAQVVSLQYIWPRDNVDDVINYVSNNGKVIGLLDEAFRRKGFKMLGGIWHGGWQRITSNIPIHSPEDIQGLKHRVMASPLLIDAYNNYGFNTISLDFGEIYGALQTGMIDSQQQSMYGIASMGFYEPTKYITCLFNEVFLDIPVANLEFFESLPEDLQKILVDASGETMEVMSSWILEYNQEKKREILEKKPSMIFYELTKEEIVPFENLAWQEGGPLDTFLKIGGKDAKAIFEALKFDVEAAEKALSEK